MHAVNTVAVGRHSLSCSQFLMKTWENKIPDLEGPA